MKKRKYLAPSLVLLSSLVSCQQGSVDPPHESELAPPGESSGEEVIKTVSQTLGRYECSTGTDTIEVFDRKCYGAMNGVAIPTFDCNDSGGSSLLGQGTVNGSEPSVHCDAPNVLNGECDPNSKFHVLHRGDTGPTPDGIYIVAHCRKRNSPNDANGKETFSDVAIISYNKNSGDTCFYQALDGVETPDHLPNHVIPPSQGTSWNNTTYNPNPKSAASAYPWLTPRRTAEAQCVKCHDNGPFIRSPYLAQLGEVWPTKRATHDPQYLPGTLYSEYATWNNGLMPYSFVGLDFQGWEAYSVQADGSSCSGCHRMGTSQIINITNPGGVPMRFSSLGTSRKLGLRATADATSADPNHQLSKNPHSLTSPIWMTPGNIDSTSGVCPSTNPPPVCNQTDPAVNKADASAISACAGQLAGNTTDVSPTPSAGCHIDRFARGNTCGPAIKIVVNGETKSVSTGYTDSPPDQVLGCKDQPGCQPGFYYWTSLHGPFYQNSPGGGDLKASSFKGSYERITVANSNWVLQRRLDATDIQGTAPSPGAPGGALGAVAYSRISSISNPACGIQPAFIQDTTGTNSVATTTPLSTLANNKLSILSGFIGNVSRKYPNAATSAYVDYLRIMDSSPNTVLTQLHSTASGINHWFKAEAWTNDCPSWSPTSYYVPGAHDVESTDDVALGAASDADKVICFITGISGDWASTRPDPSNASNPRIQPYATIYRNAGNEWRLKVRPVKNDPAGDGVSAYASCLYVN